MINLNVLLIVFILLFLFGGKRLPEFIHGLSDGLKEFKKTLHEKEKTKKTLLVKEKTKK